MDGSNVSLPAKSLPMILFYLAIGLGVLMVLLLLETTGFSVILIILALTLVVAVVTISSIMLPQLTGAPWVPTSRELVHEILALAELKQGEVLYDLGSGDGRLVIAAARDFGATAIGIEIEPFRVLYSRLKILQFHLNGKARIVRRNFFHVDLRDADVVITFLLQTTNDKLRQKLERELTRPNSRVVSIVFQFNGWEEIRSDRERTIYVYRPHSPEA
jgi:SAM-dependent methyltransferase